MTNKTETFLQPFLKKDLPDIRPGDTVRIYQKSSAFAEATTGKKEKEENKERTQVFEGLVLARKHGKEMGATIIVRKVISGIGVERVFPLHLPTIEKIEVLKRGKVRRAKLYYLRKVKSKNARLKKKEFTEAVAEKKPVEKVGESKE